MQACLLQYQLQVCANGIDAELHVQRECREAAFAVEEREWLLLQNSIGHVEGVVNE